MKIAMIASEMTPFARAGGMGDVVGALSFELAQMGHDVKVVLPKYKQVQRQRFRLKRLPDLLEAPVGKKLDLFMVQAVKLSHGTEAFFIEKPEYFDRDELYGTPQGPYPDNERRFILFQRAALELIRRLNFKPDIVHVHDWQTGLIPAMLKGTLSDDGAFKKTRTVFTVHNLLEQGLFPPDTLPETGLEWKEFSVSRLKLHGKISFLKAGLVFSDAITTVSRRYGEEIQTPEFGNGLEDVLRSRAEDLEGIVNGIDTIIWNPETDTAIARNYSADTLTERQENTTALEKELGLTSESTPLFAFVSRLRRQKGVDLLIPVLAKMAAEKMRVIVLGTGEEEYQRALQDVAERFPKYVSVTLAYDELLARRIYSGAHVVILPSLFEPCGLGQMIALRYGAVPLVRATGGLMDMIQPVDDEGRGGNGFRFNEPTPEALWKEIKRAARVFERKKAWRELTVRAMQTDVSWKQSARKYVDLYKKTARKTVTA